MYQIHTRLPSVIDGGFPTVALDRGASKYILSSWCRCAGSTISYLQIRVSTTKVNHVQDKKNGDNFVEKLDMQMRARFPR